MKTPTPEEIKAARIKAGLSQERSAEIVGREMRTWQYWENGDHNMPKGLWELYISKTQSGSMGFGMSVTILIIALCAICSVGAADYEDEMAQDNHYCEMVRLHIWPDYKRNYSNVCKGMVK